MRNKPKTHELKLEIKYFDMVRLGLKTFEVRLNDRNYGTGDILVLKEWDSKLAGYTGREVVRKVGFILSDHYSLQPNYCILSLNQ